jgi:hypothetical protein
VILEAFSHVLHKEYGPKQPAVAVLQRWLAAQLMNQTPEALDHVHHIVLTELSLKRKAVRRKNGLRYVLFVQANSISGQVLLNSLYDYCRSYEDWQYRRWLHTVKASDFKANNVN